MSGSTIGGVVGAAVGFWVGGPAGAQWGWMIGAAIGGYVDPDVIQGARIKDAQVQTSQDGVPRPIVWGTVCIAGNLIARGPWQIITVKERGKGGPVVESDKAFMTYAIRICEGPITGIGRIWRDDKLVYDGRPGAVFTEDTAQFAAKSVLYLGGEDQLPDPSLEAIYGVGNTPAYRGSAYMVVTNDDLTDRRSIPQYRFEVTRGGLFPPQETMLWWKLYDDEGETATDSSGNGYHGTYHGDYTLGAAGVHWDYSGGSGEQKYSTGHASITAPVPPELSVGTDTTWAVETTIEVQFCGLSGPSFVMLPMGGDPLFGGFNYLLCIEHPGGTANPPHLKTQSDSGGTIIDSSAQLNAFIAHMMAVRDGGSFSLYVNGGLVQTISASGLPGTAAGDFVAGGGRYYAAASSGWVGRQRDVAVYSWAPTSDYIYRRYNSSVNGVSDTVILSEIVEKIASRVGVNTDRLDVSQLTDIVRGYYIGRQMPASAAIDGLQAPYSFDRPEFNSQIRCVKRGAPTVLTITDADLIDTDDEEESRAQSIEFPRKLHVAYPDPSQNYIITKQTALRISQNVKADSETGVELALTLIASEAAPIAEKLLKVTWADAEGGAKFTLPEEFCRLTPSDCVNFNSKRYRIDHVEYLDGMTVIEAKYDRVSAYSSNATGLSPPTPTDPVSSVVGDTTFEFLNLSPLTDNDDRIGFYVAVCGTHDAWRGATLQMSLDLGTSWNTLHTDLQGTAMGDTTTALPAGIADTYDPDATVQVQMIDGSPEAATFAQLLDEANAAVIGDEVIQWADVTDEGGGLFTLTGLARGRLNTTSTSHSIGVRFVVLDGAYFIQAQSGWIGRTLRFRAVSNGNNADDADTVDVVWNPAYIQTEWPPFHFDATRDGSDNVAVSWIGRGRMGSSSSPYQSTYFDGYRVTYTDGVDSFSYTTTDQSHSYTATMQTADFGAPPVSLDVSIVAMNRITGASDALTGTI